MKLRMIELSCLTLLGLSIVSAIVVVIFLWKDGEATGLAIGGLTASLPIVINAIRNISASQAMQVMAEQLGGSQPAKGQEVAS